MEGTGDIELAGNTELLTINNQGLGKIIAYDLASKEAAITTDATGDIFVFVQDVLRVTMDGIGDVFYKGHNYRLLCLLLVQHIIIGMVVKINGSDLEACLLLCNWRLFISAGFLSQYKEVIPKQ